DFNEYKYVAPVFFLQNFHKVCSPCWTEKEGGEYPPIPCSRNPLRFLNFQVEQYFYKRKCDGAYIEPGLPWLLLPALTASLLSQRQLNFKPAYHCSGNTDSPQCYVNFMQQGSLVWWRLAVKLQDSSLNIRNAALLP
ncbi:hypothetical protein J0S82_015335, partial [Galemys pyrenaicus]